MPRFTRQCSVFVAMLVLGVMLAPPEVRDVQAASWSADFDGDHDVDLADFVSFAACFNGPNRPPAPGCAVDADFDGDVDLADFWIFATCFNGPNRLPACPPQYALTVEIPGGNGTCIPMSGTYAADTVVHLLAQPADGYRIKAWSGTDNDSLTTNDNTVTMTSDTLVTLEFEAESPPPPGMALIPAGEFLMGDSFNEGNADERPMHTVWLDALYMDKYEVTNQQYADALNWAWSQGGHITLTGGVVHKYNSGTSHPYCDTTTSSSSSQITWNGTAFGVTAGKENHPMVRVSWYGSAAFANWRSAMEGRPPGYDLSSWECNWNTGYRLPTEAEWEKAARGGVADGRFPWSDSNTIQHTRANYWSSGVYSYDTSTTEGFHPTFAVGDMPYTSPVGYFAPNGYGLYDMAGNVWEWCNDWYSETYYSSSPYDNPRGSASGTYRVLRGGGWNIDAYYCRAARRLIIGRPDLRCSGPGFRLVLGSP